MATNDKDHQVIHRAVRVLDEIESRIHELREELEANGMTSPKRGRKKADDQGHDDDHESQPQGRGKGKAGDDNLHGAAKAAHEAKAGDDDDSGDHARGQGRGKADAKHEGGDDDRQPHGQGRVKHPESDKRLKGHKDDDDAKAEKAEPAAKG